MRFRKLLGLMAALGLLAGLLALPVTANARPKTDPPVFNHVGTFDVTTNTGGEVAEIVAASTDGEVLVYTDSGGDLLGYVDISMPANPVAAGVSGLAGEPTSVAVAKDYGTNGYALVGVNTSSVTEVACLDGSDPDSVDYIDTWNGELVVIDIADRSVLATIALGGQPDSVAVSPDGRYAAIVMENERNEDVSGGFLPQGQETNNETPGIDVPQCDDVVLTASGDPRPGELIIVDLVGDPSNWTTRTVDLTGVADFAPSDPEPEFVDINDNNQAVVTLQENNHIVVVNLKNGRVTRDFPAGSTDLGMVDAEEDDLIIFSDELTKRREPDAVAWLPGNRIATADEGDYEDLAGDEGGSRGFTIFNLGGAAKVVPGMSFEYASASAGHYNEGRSENKGGEPESVEYGNYGGSDVMFVGAERANVVGVYDVGTKNAPVLLQLLPTGSGPEGLLAIPDRSLLVVANENSESGFPSLITIYEGDPAATPAYPQLHSQFLGDGTPIPWVAMSGLAGTPDDPDTIWGVSDSFLAEGYIYEIELDGGTGTIVDRTLVSDPDGVIDGAGGTIDRLDLEGIAVIPSGDGGGFWLASEGRANGSRDNAIIRVNPAGEIQEYVTLPSDLVAGATNSGFEGVAVGNDGDVYAVVQREWTAGDGGVLADPSSFVKIAKWDGSAWSFVHYVKAAPSSPAGGWVGLSEISLLPDGDFAIIERDNQLGTNATIKKVYVVDLDAAPFTGDLTSPLSTVDKTQLADVLGNLDDNSVWTPDKLEGLAVVGSNADIWLVTDNDGLDDALGQTVFITIGEYADLIP